MAKELPYFKFEPQQWDNGMIQLCSLGTKGLFLDICSTYWTRTGELPYALALQKHCKGDASILKELEENEIILIKDDKIIIQFLDEQLSEFMEVSDKRRNAAKKRWGDANAMQEESKCNAIREEKIREDKKKEEYKYSKFYDAEIENSNSDKRFIQFVEILFGNNIYNRPLNSVLAMTEQITYPQFQTMIKIKEQYGITIKEILEDMDKWNNLKKNKTVLGTFRTFCQRKNTK